MRWWSNRRNRSLAALATREIDTINLLYVGRFDDAADELDDVSARYAAAGHYPGAARALVRRVDPLLNALRMGELGADSFRLGDLVTRIPAGLRQEFDDFRDAASGRHDSGTALATRTVPEALVYLDQAVPNPIDHARHVSGSREGDVFFLRYHAPDQRIRLRIPVGPLDETHFGDGRSDLLDAGQWIAIATTWTVNLATTAATTSAATSAITSATAPLATPDPDAPDPDQVRARIREAYRQALAFVRPGTEEVAADGIWTPASREARAAQPELFRRSYLESQLA